MPEGETLPKTGKSKDWLSYADKKAQEFKDYHSATNIFGQTKNPPPLQDEYSKILSNNELQARKMGMELLRKEKTSEGKEQSRVAAYRKGGRAKRTGPAKLHKGEAVITDRKPKRTKGRNKGRSHSR